MRNKSFFLLIACVCGTVAAIGVSQWMQAQGAGSGNGGMVEIFVTSKSIDANEEITAEKIRLESWPADRAPEGATGRLEELEGKFALQKFFPGEPVMPMKLIDDSAGSGRIPPNFTEVPMKADSGGAGAAYLQPGDRVNVTAYFSANRQMPEASAKTILNCVSVYRVDGRTRRVKLEGDEEPTPAKTLSLLVHEEDVEAWTYASELGKLRITLCNPLDYQAGVESGPSEAAREFLAWMRAGRTSGNDASAGTQAPVSTPGKPKRKQFTTIKVSNGVMTEYTWIEGETTPQIRVVGDAPLSTPVSSSPAADPSGLNGDGSPLYQSEGEPDEPDFPQFEL